MRAAMLSFALLIALPALGQPPRDIRRPTPAGSARIAGMLRTADVPPRPLRRARVMLNGDALALGRTSIVDDDGTFVFEGLPPGRYTVTASKEGYVTAAYGARRPERPGRSIPLGSGESRSVELRLQRGAVLTGTVLGADGDPAPGISVTALASRYVAATGERRFALAGTAQTDDRGMYRIFGLAAGQYIVQATPRLPVNDVQVISDSELARAVARLRENTNTVFRSRPGIQTPSVPLPPEPRRSVALAPVFYPGTTMALRARMIELGTAEERAAINFQLDYVPTATISGTVSEAAAVSLMPAALSGPASGNVRATRAGVDGRFSFTGITPGEYTVLARVDPAGLAPMSSGFPPAVKGAHTEVFVNGDDLAGVSLVLEPGVTISGRVIFEGRTPPPLDLPGVRLPMPAYTRLGPTILPLPPVQLQGGGRFIVAGIMPGAYRIVGNAAGIRTSPAGWWLKSIALGGRELLDAPIELRADEDGAVITFSDRPSELSGRVTDPTGAPWVDGFVVVFSVDRNRWFFQSRRVAGARPNGDGRYMVRNLPPGEYFVLAYDDIMTGEWFDSALLEQLASRATRIRIDEYEKATYDMIAR